MARDSSSGNINVLDNIGDPVRAPYFLKSQAACEVDFNKEKEHLDLADGLGLGFSTCLLSKKKADKKTGVYGARTRNLRRDRAAL